MRVDSSNDPEQRMSEIRGNTQYRTSENGVTVILQAQSSLVVTDSWEETFNRDGRDTLLGRTVIYSKNILRYTLRCP